MVSSRSQDNQLVPHMFGNRGPHHRRYSRLQGLHRCSSLRKPSASQLKLCKEPIWRGILIREGNKSSRSDGLAWSCSNQFCIVSALSGIDQVRSRSPAIQSSSLCSWNRLHLSLASNKNAPLHRANLRLKRFTVNPQLRECYWGRLWRLSDYLDTRLGIRRWDGARLWSRTYGWGFRALRSKARARTRRSAQKRRLKAFKF